MEDKDKLFSPGSLYSYFYTYMSGIYTCFAVDAFQGGQTLSGVFDSAVALGSLGIVGLCNLKEPAKDSEEHATVSPDP